MVNCDVSTTNGKLGRWKVGVSKGVVGLVLDVEWTEEGLLGDVLGGLSLDNGRGTDDSSSGKDLLEGWLEAMLIDIIVSCFLADAIAAEVMIAIDVVGDAAFTNRS